MRFQRRQLLRILSFAFWSSFILSRNQLGIAAQSTTQPTISPPAGAAVGHGFAGETEMEKVTGIGDCSSELTIRQRWGVGISNTWGSRSHQRATRNPFGSKRQDPPFSLLSLRRATISGMSTRSGW